MKMAENEVREEKEMRKYNYDFMKERKWIFVVGGWGYSNSILYYLYLLMIFGVLLFPGAMGIYGAYQTYPNKLLVIEQIKLVLNCTFGTWGLLTGIMTRNSLKEARHFINSGFYVYKDETTDEGEQKLREGVFESIRTNLNTFLFIILTGSIVSTFYFPISQYMLVTEEEYERMVDTTNPYLPHFFHVPFSTRGFGGFVSAFIIILFFHYYVYGATTIIYFITISCTKQLEVQLKILNYSIRNIQKRALNMYIRNSRIKLQHHSPSDIYRKREFQQCLIKCLRANIEHHQALLRFWSKVRPVNASTFLLLVIVASISEAVLLSLILEKPPLNFMMIYISLLLSEQIHTFYICTCGEKVMEESGKIFESLYATEWWNNSKKFSRILAIFMCYTMKPMKVKAMLIDFTASHEVYGSFQSAMYKFLNIMRESDGF